MNVFRLSRQVILSFCILWALGFGLYAQTLNDPFQFDDAVTIVGNKAAHLLPDWPSTVKGLLAFQPSRFVTNITFAFNYYAGRLDTAGYHAVNILVHLITAILVWWLGTLFVMLSPATHMGEQNDQTAKAVASRKKKAGKSTQINIHPHAYIPFLAALVFLAHPVNTQAVTYISQRSEALAALFYVASVCCYIQGRIFVAQRTPLFIGAVICGLLASFSKETAITLPLMIVVIEVFFLNSRTFAIASLRAERSEAKQSHARMRLLRAETALAMTAFNSNTKALRKKNDALPRRILFGALGLGFLLLIPSAFNFNYAQMLSEAHLSQSHLGDVLTLPTYLLTQVRVFVTFLRLVFLPVGLNLDHDYPMIQTVFDPAFLGSLGVLTGIGAVAFIFRRKYPMLVFAAVWFFLTLSSNLVPRAHVMFEHKLYLVLAGILPALCLGVAALVNNRRAMTGTLCFIIVVFAALTIQRNRVWDSEITLWEDVLKKSPNKARVHLSLGAAYARAGQYERALQYMTNAIDMLGDPHRAYSNRGAVYVKMRKDDLALADLNQAIAHEPRFLDAYLNRAEIFARKQNYTAALKDLEDAIVIDPEYAPAYRMRGRIFDAMRQYDRAWADYNKALAIDPGDARALAWRGYLHALDGRLEDAFADFNAALRLDPDLSDAYVYRGMYYKDRRQKEAALSDLDRAIALSPDSSLAYYQRASARFDFGELDASLTDVNKAIVLDDGFDLPYSLRGIIHARRKEYAEAMTDFSTAIKLNPRSGVHYFNRCKLYKEQGHTDAMINDARQASALGFPVPKSYFNEKM